MVLELIEVDDKAVLPGFVFMAVTDEDEGPARGHGENDSLIPCLVKFS
jgi:hypothetical protein